MEGRDKNGVQLQERMRVPVNKNEKKRYQKPKGLETEYREMKETAMKK